MYRDIKDLFLFSVCEVIEQGTNSIVPCSFPFILDERRFDNCTDYQDPNGELWCSTKTDTKTLEHIGGNGHWGFCTNDYCPKATTASPLGK